MAADKPLGLDEIQGNILAGFNKDHASFLLFSLPEDPGRAQGWLRDIVDEVATTAEVQAFNALFKMIRARHHREGAVEAAWMNVAFTHAGLAALGVTQQDLDAFPPEYREGMRARASQIGDLGANDPSQWVDGLGTKPIHALMIVAADSAEDRNREVLHFVRHAARFGLQLQFQQDGMTRRDAPGHEHFGFKDGISQPGVEGFTENPIPGQDLIAAGEFVLGYRRQGEEPVPPSSGYPPPAPQDPLTPQPDWSANGSYLVFRRLAQDVGGFQDFVLAQAQAEGLSLDLLGAKLVGRYRSGAPLEGAGNAAQDPGATDPGAIDDQHINDFEYSSDPDGTGVPRAAHIRKSYPRDQEPPGEAESERRRIMRRGIPFGHSFHHGSQTGSPYAVDAAFPHDRGLCFVCYQRSIADQFEFLQEAWVNSDNFPQGGDGVDPIISQAQAQRSFHLPGGAVDPVALTKQWVTTTGGEYFFSPSISAIRLLGGA
jgi:Dyp-type peroxidase family